MLEANPHRIIGDWVYEQTKGIVQSGPFKGMIIPREQGWQDGTLSPALLGCHEQELHGVIEYEIERLSGMDRPVVVNVGCAEGYYTVGLSRRLPNALVWGIDTNLECLTIAKDAVVANHVGAVLTNDLRNAFENPALIVMDCEGAEVDYLDMEKHPALREAHILVEIHNSKQQNSGDIVSARFRDSHKILFYEEGARNPNEFEFLCYYPSNVRWMAMCENRPACMHWLHMVPRGVAGGENPEMDAQEI